MLIVDTCACGCGKAIHAGDRCFVYDGFRFRLSFCVAKYVGAKRITAAPYKKLEG